jgi:HSP20 family protein
MNDDWRKKKRGFNFFFDFDNIQRMVDEMMRDMFDDEMEFKPRKPLVMGFNIRVSEDGKPVIERFGNLRAEGGKPMVSDAREPLVDVIESDKDVTITAELPGVEKKDIRFRVPSKKSAIIEVKGERSFYKELSLPASVKVKSAKAKFKNGVLEVRLEKEVSAEKRKKGEVKIE